MFIDAARPCRHSPGDGWFVDETYIKIGCRWCYMHRAVDQFGQVIDVRSANSGRKNVREDSCADSVAAWHMAGPLGGQAFDSVDWFVICERRPPHKSPARCNVASRMARTIDNKQRPIV